MLKKIREDAQSVPMNIVYKLENELCTIEDQDEVLALNDPWYAYYFARDVPGADVERCQEIACKDPESAYCFARYIPGANIKICQEGACKDSCWAYYFALNIPGANIEKCQEACQSPYFMYMFAKNVLNKKFEKY